MKTLRPSVKEASYPTNDDGQEFNPYEKCTISSTLTDIPIKFLPIEKSMFSGLTRLPKIQTEITSNALPCPSTVNYLELTPTELLLRGLVQYKEFRKHDEKKVITFKAFLDSYKGHLSKGKQVTLLEQPDLPEQKNVQTQTDFRENSTQTEPYSPPYYIAPGAKPELLKIAVLSYGCGLPAGLAEVEMIERLRKKRIWEIEQKKLSDKCQIELSLKKLEEQQTLEWALRDKEIERILDLRLTFTIKMLSLREKQNDEKYKTRLESMWCRKEEEGQKKLEKINYNSLRAIRKIIWKANKIEKGNKKRDVAEDYTDFGSQAFAPLTRIGVFFDKNAQKYEVQSPFLNTFAGIQELEEYLNKSWNQDIEQVVGFDSKTVEFIKLNRKKEKQLEQLFQSLQRERTGTMKSPRPLKFLQKIERPTVRPPTPTLSFRTDNDINAELAATFLEQTIRGRSLQKMMLKGKEERIELIKEMRSTHALLKSEQDILDAQKLKTINLQNQKIKYDEKEDVVNGILSELEGDTLAYAFDFLTKELERLKEERKIEAFVMLAERNRRMREAEESGMRQIEERRRRGMDEAFKQIVKVHQETVDNYLEDIILSTIERSADEQARKEMQVIAEKIDKAAQMTEAKSTSFDAEEIVAQLVHGFLLPEVNKQISENKVKALQQRHLETAHKMFIDKEEESPKSYSASQIHSLKSSQRQSDRYSQRQSDRYSQRQSDKHSDKPSDKQSDWRQSQKSTYYNSQLKKSSKFI